MTLLKAITDLKDFDGSDKVMELEVKASRFTLIASASRTDNRSRRSAVLASALQQKIFSFSLKFPRETRPSFLGDLWGWGLGSDIDAIHSLVQQLL